MTLSLAKHQSSWYIDSSSQSLVLAPRETVSNFATLVPADPADGPRRVLTDWVAWTLSLLSRHPFDPLKASQSQNELDSLLSLLRLKISIMKQNHSSKTLALKKMHFRPKKSSRGQGFRGCASPFFTLTLQGCIIGGFFRRIAPFFFFLTAFIHFFSGQSKF